MSRSHDVLGSVLNSPLHTTARVRAEPANLTPQRFGASTSSAKGARCAACIEMQGLIYVQSGGKNITRRFLLSSHPKGGTAMNMVEIIEKKKLGQPLTAEDIDFFVAGAATGSVPD